MKKQLKLKKIVKWENKPKFLPLFFAIGFSAYIILGLFTPLMFVKVISIVLILFFGLAYLTACEVKFPKRKVYYEEVE